VNALRLTFNAERAMTGREILVLTQRTRSTRRESDDRRLNSVLSVTSVLEKS